MDSRIINDNGCIISWKVNKISDRYNNYIKFSYSTSDDERPLALIEYTGNSSLSQSPFAEIIFHYSNRSDTSSYCYGGKEFTRKILLDDIEVKQNGQSFKNYKLSYIIDEYSQLQKVTEYSSQDKELNPTIFAWTRQSEEFTQTTNYSGTNDELCFVGDFNGDGREDLVTIPNQTSYSTVDKWNLYLADANGTMVYTSQGDLNTQFETFLVGDFNGDGLTDLMMQENFSQSDKPNEKKYFFYQATGSSFDRKAYYYTCLNNDNLNIVDYNGDGELEFLYHDDSTNWYLYTYSGTYILNTSIPSNGMIYILDEGIPNGIVDFNGDGCSDLLQLSPDGYKVSEFKGSISGTFIIGTYQGANINETDFRLFGDFNGDGCTEILKKSDSGWSMLVLTSQGFKEEELSCFDNFNIATTNNRFFARDMNGDGKDDVVIVGRGQNTNNSYDRINVAISSGNNFSLTEYVSSTFMNYDSDQYFYFGDFKGEGRSQFLYKYCGGYNIAKLFSFANGTPSHLVTTIIDGLGVKIKLSYLPMSNSSIYTRGTGAVYPLSDYSSSTQLVSNVQSDNGLGTINTISYQYEGAIMHRRGDGLTGFSKITATNSATGITTERNYSFDETFFYPQLTSVYNKQGSTILASVTNTWSKINYSNKYYFPYISSTTQTDNLAGLTTNTTATYDSYGNPVLFSLDYGNGYTQTLTYNYADERISDWLIGRPTTITETSVKNGITSTFVTNRTYLSTCNLPDVDTYNSEDASMWRYDRDYDSFGNLWKEHITTTGLGESLTIYEYDDNEVNLTKITDPLGNETHYTWYPANGLIHTQTDPFGNETSYTYNNADLLSSISSTNQITRTVTSSMEFSDGPANALYYIQVAGDDGSLAKTWYNKLGQVIRSEDKGFDGSMIKADRQYNIKGQLIRVSEPSTATPSQWNLIEYDNYGRITSNDPYYGATSSFSYSGATFTRTSNNRAFSSTINSAGLVTFCSDPGGNILYDYYPEGLAKSVQVPGGAVTSFTYDKNGNRLTITDPSAGTITNTYYGTGQLKTSQNARGQSTTYYYQTNGLLDYYTTAEGTTDYSYNSSGQVSSISSPGGVTRSFTYDAHGRVNTVSESIGTVGNTISFTYDNKGRLSRKYFNGTTDYEQFDYNSNGYLYLISFNGTTVWQLNTMDEYFRIRQANIGTTPCSWSFDGNNMLSQINATGVQQYNYSFNVNTGNLNSRTNYLKNLTESFSYDTSDLDRLTSITGPQNQSITYETNGNILSKSDAGTYSYDGSNYAVTGISDGLNIDTLRQTIEYYSFEKVKKITQGTKTADFTYNAENQRIFMVIKDNGTVTKSRWYLGGDFEREEINGVVSQYIWIGGDPYSAVAVAKKDGNGAWVVYNIFRDHLGTITHLKSVNGVYEYSFDAWGRRRDKDTWSYTLDSEPSLFADRGFTAHEFLADFNLYNMNGRLYDPVTARFLSPDIYVQSPDFTQSYNRYSYCLNNPLKYVDPSGDDLNDFEYYGHDDPNKCKYPDNKWNKKRARQSRWHNRKKISWVGVNNDDVGNASDGMGSGQYGYELKTPPIINTGYGGGGSGSFGNIESIVHGLNAGINNPQRRVEPSGGGTLADEDLVVLYANMLAMKELGLSTKDIESYGPESSLYSKLSRLNNPQNYIKGWHKSFNSSSKKFDAFISPVIGNTGFALKYYSTKNGYNDAIGLVKVNEIGHYVESSLEIEEAISVKFLNFQDDWLYDMHLNNSIQFIRTKL